MREAYSQDETNLRDLLIAVWHGKYFILLCSILCLVVGITYLRISDTKYRVSLILAPVQEEQTTPNFGNLGGLASLAGISLPASNASDFAKFEIMLITEEIAAQIFKDKILVRSLFKNQWDETDQTFKQPRKTTIKVIIDNFKELLTGQTAPPFIGPTAGELARLMRADIDIKLDRKTKYLNIKIETAEPELLTKLLLSMINNTDALFKKKFVKQAGDAVKFYQNKISKARSQEHREILATLIAKEERKLLLASQEGPFVAEILTGPNTSIKPTSPKIGLVLALSIFMGIFISCSLILLKDYLKTNQDNDL